MTDMTQNKWYRVTDIGLGGFLIALVVLLVILELA